MMDTIGRKNSGCPKHEQLSAYVDRELEPAVARAVAAHISLCDGCAGNVAAMEDLSRAFRALPHPQTGFEIGRGIELMVARDVRQRRLARAWRFAPVSLAAAATVVLGVSIGTMLATSTTMDDDVVAMAIFDAVPPGGVCIGFDPCYSRDKI